MHPCTSLHNLCWVGDRLAPFCMHVFGFHQSDHKSLQVHRGSSGQTESQVTINLRLYIQTIFWDNGDTIFLKLSYYQPMAKVALCSHPCTGDVTADKKSQNHKKFNVLNFSWQSSQACHITCARVATPLVTQHSWKMQASPSQAKTLLVKQRLKLETCDSVWPRL